MEESAVRQGVRVICRVGCRASALVVVVAALVAVSSPPASAAIRQLAVSWAAPPQLPSITPEPPVVDTSPYIHTASVAYDDSSGAVTGSFSLYDPSYWEQNLSPSINPSVPEDSTVYLEIDLATDCADGPPTPGIPGSGGANWSGTDLTLNVAPEADSNGVSDQAEGDASLSGYQGTISGPGSFDGTNYSVTLQSPYFAGRDFRCAYFSPANMGNPQGWAWLDGYAPPPPLPTLVNPWTGKFAVRPGEIGLSGDGSSFLAGARQHGRQRRSNPNWAGRIAWSSWTATQAIGSGANWHDNCEPDCASGHYYPSPVRLRAYDPSKGHFTRLWMRERYRGKWHTYILKLTYDGGAWYWG
jgi:hypothetical protein